MTPDLLALLSPEQQAAWERCQKATPGPWDWVPTAYMFTGDAEMPDDEFTGAAILADGQVIFGVTEDTFEPYPRDSAFIQNARLDLPAALLELASTKQKVEKMQTNAQAWITAEMKAGFVFRVGKSEVHMKHDPAMATSLREMSLQSDLEDAQEELAQTKAKLEEWQEAAWQMKMSAAGCEQFSETGPELLEKILTSKVDDWGEEYDRANAAETKLAELRAAVSRLAHEELCCYPNGPDEDTPCNCQLSRLPK